MAQSGVKTNLNLNHLTVHSSSHHCTLMSTLQLEIPQKGAPNRSYVFEPTDSILADIVASTFGDTHLTFTATRTLFRDNPRVYRGNLVSTDAQYSKDVSCKLVFGDIDALEKEAKFYQTSLKDVQGSLVPRFLAYFSGISSYTQNPIACLLTEYAGEHVRSDSWFRVPIVTRCVLCCVT